MAVDIKGALTQKIGPFPGYVWAGVVAVGGILILPHLKGSAQSTQGAGQSYAGPGPDSGPVPGSAPPTGTTLPTPNVTPGAVPVCGPGTKLDPTGQFCVPVVSVTQPPPATPGCGPGQYYDTGLGRCVFPPNSTSPNAPSMQPPTVAPPKPGTPGYAPGAGSTVPKVPVGSNSGAANGGCGSHYNVALGRNVPNGSFLAGDFNDPGCLKAVGGPQGVGGPNRRNLGLPHLHLAHRGTVLFPHYVKVDAGQYWKELDRVSAETGVHAARLRILNPTPSGIVRVA